LDHDYVGAVIIGGRMGISEHVEENVKVFSFRLDEEDKLAIKARVGRRRCLKLWVIAVRNIGSNGLENVKFN
jgi:hypothetical protein